MDIQVKIIDWLMANRSEIHQQVEIVGDTQLLSDGLLDSLGLLQLVTYIEDEYNLKVPVELLMPENFSTPASITSLASNIMARH